jgi:hypothetical protein
MGKAQTSDDEKIVIEINLENSLNVVVRVIVKAKKSGASTLYRHQ